MNKHMQAGRTLLKLGALALFAAAPPLAHAQAGGDRISVPLTDPSRPALVRAGLLYGGITVKGADIKEVTVEVRPHAGDDDGRESRKGGLRRLSVPSTSLSIEEENNQVRVSGGNRAIELVITVPRRTSLQLNATNDGDITVDGVEGELNINNTNGAVTVTNVSGSAVVHALNENIVVKFNRVSSDKPMAFSSLNGDIDVTFPSDFKAVLVLSTGNGNVYTDFEAQLQTGAPQQVVEDGRGKGGKYKVKVEKTVRYSVGGGGAEIKFTNYNGDIYIRKAGASAAQ